MPRFIARTADQIGPLRNADDAELVEACEAGRPEAWDELIARYGRLVFSIARRYGLDVSASEDVFQEVFAALVKQLPSLRCRGAIRGWLITTARRKAGRWIENARRAGQAGIQESDFPAADSSTDPLHDWERQQMVREALRKLGGRCEQLLAALYLQPGPVSYRSIADELGISHGAVGPTRARCLLKLLDLLKDSAAP